MQPVRRSDTMTDNSSAYIPRAGRRPAPAQGALPGAVRTSVIQAAISPWTWIYCFLIAAFVLLLVPLNLPIGGYYWDITLYPDAAWRIANGQIPHVDFFAPVGAFGYYAFAILQRVFPNGHLLLLADWSVLLAALPLFVCTIRQIDRESRFIALFLTLPFLLFAGIPLNTTEVYPLAGMDGFGIYNRQISVLLYVLVSVLLFVPDMRSQILLLAGLLLTLFFTKITGFVVGMGLIVHAMTAGLVRPRTMLFAGMIAAGVAFAVEAASGLVSAYMHDLGLLVAMNSDDLISRLRSPIIQHLDVILPMLALAALTGWLARQHVLALFENPLNKGFFARLRTFANLDAVWLVTLLAGAILFESQNSGSQEFILLWPLLFRLLQKWYPEKGVARTAVLVLIAIITLPTVLGTVHRTLRIAGVSLVYSKLDEPVLGKLGEVYGKPELLARAHTMKAYYAGTRPYHERLAARNVQTSHLLFSENDFQLLWMITTADAVKAIRRFEALNRVSLDSLITLDFVDPLTFLLRREPLRHLSIGMMIGRTIPPLRGRRLAAAKKADAVLVPRCPATPTRHHLEKTFAPVLKDRVKVALTPCWDMYVSAGLKKILAL